MGAVRFPVREVICFFFVGITMANDDVFEDIAAAGGKRADMVERRVISTVRMELLERYQKCGVVGAAHNCYKALIHKYGSIEVAAKNVPFSYDTIEAWKKKRRGTSFENVINIANTIAVSPKELL